MFRSQLKPFGVGLLIAASTSWCLAATPRQSREIAVVPLVELGHGIEGAWIGTSPIVACGNGRYYVTSRETGSQIQVFSGSGHLEAEWGREGEGPGEFRFIRSMNVDASGSLHVFDSRNARWTILSGDGALVTTVSLRAGTPSLSAMAFDGDSALVAGSMAGPDDFGFDALIFDVSGRVVRRVGDPRSHVPPSGPFPGYAVAPSTSGGVWSTPLFSFELRLWKDDTTPAIRISRTPEWMAPTSASEPGPEGPTTPQPGILQLWEDVSGRLWVVGRGIDRRWPSVAAGKLARHPNNMFDVVLEVWDPGGAQLVAKRQMDAGVFAFCGSNLAYTVRESDIGTSIVEVKRVTLAERSF